MKALADSMVMDLSALGHTLKPLTRNGWLELIADSEDGRVRRVRLTREGKIKFDDAMVSWRSVQDRFEAAIGAKKSVELRALLRFVLSDEFEHAFRSSAAAEPE